MSIAEQTRRMSRDIWGNEGARQLREVRSARRGYEWGQYVTVLEYPTEEEVETGVGEVDDWKKLRKKQK